MFPATTAHCENVRRLCEYNAVGFKDVDPPLYYNFPWTGLPKLRPDTED